MTGGSTPSILVGASDFFETGGPGGFQMVGSSCAQIGGQQGAGIGSELVGMHPQPQAERLRGAQNPAGLLHREDVGLADNVTVPGQPFAGHGRQHFVDNQVAISIAASPVFIRNFMAPRNVGT